MSIRREPRAIKGTDRHHPRTVLLLLGVSERTIMGIMGWSNTAMTRRYAHMVDPIRHETASRIDGLLWSVEAPDKLDDLGETEGRLSIE